MTLPLGILVSGSGTNMQALLDGMSAGQLDAEPRVVISNRADAYALERAKRAEVPTVVIEHKKFPSRELFDAELVKTLRDHGVEWIALAGFMRVLTPVFLDAFSGRIVNIHPSLLPAFPGVDAQGQAFRYGVKVTGCTVHFVDRDVDTGPIILQRTVTVRPDDTDDSLRARILVEEHGALLEAWSLIASGRLHLVSEPGQRDRVVVDPPPSPQEP